MGLKDLFGKKVKSDAAQNPSFPPEVAAFLSGMQEKREKEIAEVENNANRLTDAELQGIFAEYFAPNQDFYGQPDSDKFKAYFGAVNAATLEMLNNPQLFYQATKREQAELLEMCNNRIPGLTNSLICGLIFCMGRYAVVPSYLLCVDFSEKIPNCIAVYLLLTAQKLPPESRKQLIDAGDGINPLKLIEALNALSICDPSWKYHFMGLAVDTEKTEEAKVKGEETFDAIAKQYRRRYSLDNQRLCFLSFFLTEKRTLDSISIDVEAANDYHFKVGVAELPKLCDALGCESTEEGLVKALTNRVSACKNPIEIGSMMRNAGMRFDTYSY